MSDTSKTLVLVAAGVGAYLLLTRRAATAAPAGGGTAAAPNPLSQIVNAALSLFGAAGSRSTTTAGGFVGAGVQSGVPAWDDAYRRALTGTGAVIETAVNPVNSSVYDWGTGSQWGNVDYGDYL